MHGLLEAMVLAIIISFVLFLAMLFIAGRNGHHWLNGHVEMPEDFDPRTLLRMQKEEDAAASEFFAKVEEFRRDLA